MWESIILLYQTIDCLLFDELAENMIYANVLSLKRLISSCPHPWLSRNRWSVIVRLHCFNLYHRNFLLIHPVLLDAFYILRKGISKNNPNLLPVESQFVSPKMSNSSKNLKLYQFLFYFCYQIVYMLLCDGAYYTGYVWRHKVAEYQWHYKINMLFFFLTSQCFKFLTKTQLLISLRT